jgi:hypothetical protein
MWGEEGSVMRDGEARTGRDRLRRSGRLVASMESQDSRQWGAWGGVEAGQGLGVSCVPRVRDEE